MTRKALAVFLFIILASCGSHQGDETTPEPVVEPPPPPADYASRLELELQEAGVPLESLSCNRRVVWGETLHDDAEAFWLDLEANIAPLMRRRIRDADQEMIQEQVTSLAMNWFIRTLLIHGDNNNLGAVVLNDIQWTDAEGRSHPLIVFHSATLPFAEREGSCLRSLIEDGNVRHVVNLYDGAVPLRDQLDAEARVSQELEATHVDSANPELGYRGWREVAGDEEATDEDRLEAHRTVARLIREQILRPGGQPPQGNVYFHCAGGMHRSPMVSGILRRCIANQPLAQVRESMQAHSAYVDEENDGGWEEPTYEFVRSFDCSLLVEADDSGDDSSNEDSGGIESEEADASGEAADAESPASE